MFEPPVLPPSLSSHSPTFHEQEGFTRRKSSAADAAAVDAQAIKFPDSSIDLPVACLDDNIIDDTLPASADPAAIATIHPRLDKQFSAFSQSSSSLSSLSQPVPDMMPHIQSIEPPTLTPQNSHKFLEQPNTISTTPKQPTVSLSPISRNPSSSEETNSEGNNSERNPSNRSMSSIATSFDSVTHRPVSKYYDGHGEHNASTSNSTNNTSDTVNLPDQHTTHAESHVLDNKNFPFPQSSPAPLPQNHTHAPTGSPNNSISTAKLDHLPSKYVQPSPKRALSTSSSASSISSHKLVSKPSASSLSRPPNFSTYRSPTPSVTTTSDAAGASTTTVPSTVTAVIQSPEPVNGIGIAIDRPVILEDGTALASKQIPPEDIGPLDKVPDVVQQAIPRQMPAPIITSDRITQLPPPPNVHLVQRNSSSSQTSTGSRTSTHLDDVRSSGSQHHKNPMTIVRRRSLAPQQLASSQNLHPDERTVLYRERVITMRELKRQKRKEYEEDERVLVGNKVSEGHVDYATAYYMLTGIRVSVSRCNAKINRELTDADFTARHKLAFDVTGNELIPSSKYDFKFKDYSPWVFRHLRELFQLDPADYLMSLTSKYIVSQLSSPGKSGSLFYFSRDYRFIIKTIHHSEHKMLRKILKDYYNHVKNNPNTLISQFYGLHRIKLPLGRKIHFIVMNNLFPPHHDLHRTYDLKGSTLGREYISKDGRQKEGAVLKDLNWIAKGESLKLGPAKAEMFVNQLKRDVALLKKLNIMDYSLLVGIHDKSQGDKNRHSVLVLNFDKAAGSDHMKAAELRKAVNSTSPTETTTLDLFAATFGQRDLYFYRDDGGFQATDSNDQPLDEIYYLGVIDCLTPYTFYKRVETFFKGLSHARQTISAIPAAEYGDRFFDFMKKAIKTKKAQLENVEEGPTGELLAEPSRLRQNAAASREDRDHLSVVVESISREVTPKSSPPAINEQT